MIMWNGHVARTKNLTNAYKFVSRKTVTKDLDGDGWDVDVNWFYLYLVTVQW
jgi:hypothetical protein